MSVSVKTNPVRGIVSMVLGCGAAVGGDAATKWLTASHPIGEVLFFRTIFVLVPIAVLVWRSGGLATLRVTSIRDQSLRALLAVGSAALVLASLAVLPLAEVTSLLHVGPLFVAALAAPLLGERVGWRRSLAILVGFAGVVVVTHPGGDTFRAVAFVPIAAAFAAALRDIVTRRISTTEHTTAIFVWSTLALLGPALATLPFGWEPMDANDLIVAAIAGLLIGISDFLIIEAYRHAEANVVSPYRYTNLLWAAVLGSLLWGELPSLWLLAGAPLIVGSGIYMLLHSTSHRGPGDSVVAVVEPHAGGLRALEGDE